MVQRKIDVFQPLSKENGFAALSQRQSPTPSILPTISAVVVDEIAAGSADEMDHAVPYLSISFLSNIKQIVSNNTIHILDDAELLQLPVIRSLVLVHGTGLNFLFF